MASELVRLCPIHILPYRTFPNNRCVCPECVNNYVRNTPWVLQLQMFRRILGQIVTHERQVLLSWLKQESVSTRSSYAEVLYTCIVTVALQRNVAPECIVSLIVAMNTLDVLELPVPMSEVEEADGE